MDNLAASKQIVDDVFSATGAKMSPDDPLVIAALFYSQEMRQAGTVVANELEKHTAGLRAAVQGLVSSSAQSEADRAKHLRDIEARIVKCMQIASGGAGQKPLRYVPAWYAFAGAVVGAILISTSWVFGVERGSSQADAAAIGRSFARAVSSMDPKLREELINELRRKPD